MRLGIDFGTTRTVVAAVEQGNYPVCSFSLEGEAREYLPSLAAWSRGRLLYGWEAAACQADPDAVLLRSMKRLVGALRPDDPVTLGPHCSVPLLQLVTGFLAHAREWITRRSNLIMDPEAPIEVLVGTPANANSNQRYVTLEAFQRAGFTVVEVMNEPSAAAVEFVHRYLRSLGGRSPKEYVVVYDLGGGTFDTSVVGFSGRNYEVLAHEGLSRLGGDDFDQIILELVLEQAGVAPSELDPAQEVRLLEECRVRKEGLSPNTRKLVVDLQPIVGEESTVVLSTDAIYRRATDLVAGSVACVDTLLAALARAGIDPEDGRSLAAVYLVGGSVAFPPVSRMLRARFARKVKTSPFPHASTAIGLAISADPEAGVRLSETVSRHFGVWREHGRDKVFDPIIPKDSRMDGDRGAFRVTRRYQPLHNVGHLRYLECGSVSELGEPSGDMAFWKEVLFPYDPALEATDDLSGVPVEERPDLLEQDVWETYSYDRQGIIRVEIENRRTGHRRAFSLGKSA